MRNALAAAMLLGGCLFDPSGLAPEDRGIPGDRRPDVAADLVPADLPADEKGLVDLDAPVEATLESSPDSLSDLPTVVADLPRVVPDLLAVVPLSAAALGAALYAATVPCVDKNGTSNGTTIPVADSATIKLFNGQVALAGAAPNTKTWVGGKPSVIVVWDINACDDEAPSGNAEWSTAGLLVRGASLDGQGQLVLQPGAAVIDINAVDVNGDGTWQGEFCLPDDSLIPSSYPQLLAPFNKAKQLVIQLGTP